MIDHKDATSTSIIERHANNAPPRTLRSWVIGRPLSTADAPHQTIGKAVGLAVFASDALSSTAYATQEILGVVAVAGTMAYGYLFPISLAIVALLTVVTISYEQTIHAYPGGGGAYIVARDNLGELPAQTAGAALLTDYILTVAVSISAGVAQIVSAYPVLFPYRVWIAVFAVFLIMLINLRGVKESGTAFAILFFHHRNGRYSRFWHISLLFRIAGYGSESSPFGSSRFDHGHHTVYPAPRVCQRHDCAHRSGSDLQRNYSLQGAAQ